MYINTAYTYNDRIYKGVIMVSKDLLEILRCPVCVQNKAGMLKVYRDSWLICSDCNRKYPIRHDIPVMLIDEGDRWIQVEEANLPVPPPEK